MKYVNRQWSVSQLDAGYRLTEQLTDAQKAAKAETRVLFVDVEGVKECSRDGKATPLTLIDCGPATLYRIAAELKTNKPA